MDHDNRKLLREGAQKFGIDLGEEALDKFSHYLEVLEGGTARMNLTAIQGERDRVVLLLLDSLAAAGYVAERFGDRNSPGIRMMDLGSGAGVPGIPVKIALPWVRITLCDSRHKRAVFLEEAVRELGLPGCEVFAGRAEDFQIESDRPLQGKIAEFSQTSTHEDFQIESDRPLQGEEAGAPGGFEVVAAKAVGDLGYLARTCRKLMAPEGILLAMKGPAPEEEIRRDEKKVTKAGFKVIEVRTYDLADRGRRSLVILGRGG